MSSFEPDPMLGGAAFRPSGLERPATATSADAFAPHRRLASSRPAEKPKRAGVEAQATACTAAQHAALEQAGYAKGRASAEVDRERALHACEVFENAGVAMGRVSVRMLHENRERMIELAGEIARLWLGAELRLEPARLAVPLERALALCEDAVAATVRLHPDVLAALQEAVPDRIAAWSRELEVELVADPSIEASGFRIVTETRSIASGLDQLAGRVREAVAEAFEAKSEEAPES